jgi:hypothetical protein
MPGKEFFSKQVSIQWVISTLAGAIVFCAATLISFSANWTKLNDKLDTLIAQQGESTVRSEKRIEQENALFAAHDSRLNVVERNIDRHDFRLESVERVLQLKIPVRK